MTLSHYLSPFELFFVSKFRFGELQCVNLCSDSFRVCVNSKLCIGCVYVMWHRKGQSMIFSHKKKLSIIVVIMNKLSGVNQQHVIQVIVFQHFIEIAYSRSTVDVLNRYFRKWHLNRFFCNIICALRFSFVFALFTCRINSYQFFRVSYRLCAQI